jgi:hypothetical protein
MIYKRIRKKRFVKILMSAGCTRNEAYMYASLVLIFGSYFDLAKAICGRYE